MRIYIASALPNLSIAREWAVSLRGAGHEITSTWHDDASNTVESERDMHDDYKGFTAVGCMEEIRSSAALVWLHGCADGRVGAAIEVGFAFAVCDPLGHSPNIYAFSLDGQPPPSVFGTLCESVCDLSDLLARLS